MWFKHGSHATIDLFIFALDSKSFLKDDSIVTRTKEITCFNAWIERTFIALYRSEFQCQPCLKALASQTTQTKCVNVSQTTLFILRIWPLRNQQMPALFMAFYRETQAAMFTYSSGSNFKGAPRRQLLMTVYCHKLYTFTLCILNVNLSTLNKQGKLT